MLENYFLINNSALNGPSNDTIDFSLRQIYRSTKTDGTKNTQLSIKFYKKHFVTLFIHFTKNFTHFKRNR